MVTAARAASTDGVAINFVGELYMQTRSKTREDYAFNTPDHLWDSARQICVEPNREYPYLAEFQLNDDGSFRLFGLHTLSRSMSSHYGELIGRTGWDVDWIERDQQYAYHQSSGGGSLRHEVSGIYWRHPAMLHMVREQTARYCDRAFRKRNKTRRVKRIPIDLARKEDLMKFLEYYGTNSEVYYCSICKQYLPENEQCEHVWWCDSIANMRGPGSPDYPDPCEDLQDCFYCNRIRERAIS